MVDFAALAKKPSGQGKKMEALPVDTYPGIIRSFEWGDANKNKTPYLRVHGLITGPGNVLGTAEELARLEIDPTKRQFRKDFYLRGADANDKEAEGQAMYRLDQFLRSCGIEADGRAYEELLPQLIAKPVMVEIQQYLNQTTSDIGNQTGQLVGQG